MDYYASLFASKVSGGGGGGGSGWDPNDVAEGNVPTGDLVLNTATSIGKYVFASRTAIESVSAPNCLKIKERAFLYCTGLKSISFPALTDFDGTNGTYVFDGCTNLTVAVFPSLSGILLTRTFNNCSKLTTIDLGTSFSDIGSQATNGALALRTLVLRSTSGVVKLFAWNATTMGGIYNNPSASTIYVPSALVSSYQTATNWSTAYGAGLTFSAIEGSIYETKYADGTTIGA